MGTVISNEGTEVMRTTLQASRLLPNTPGQHRNLLQGLSNPQENAGFRVEQFSWMLTDPFSSKAGT